MPVKEQVKEKVKLVALVRKERGGDVNHIKATAPSKYAFRQKLKEKSYRILVILSKDEVIAIKKLDFDDFKEEWFVRLAESEQQRIYDYVTDQI
jgi:hypothetical protein